MRRAFLIGIGRYADHPVPAGNDLEILAQALEYRGYQGTEIVRFDDTHTTYAEIVQALEAIRTEYLGVDKGSCLVHVSAHGALCLEPLQGGIVPTDGRDDQFETVIPFSMLNDYLPVRDGIDVLASLDT
jgi:hypothetical protein